MSRLDKAITELANAAGGRPWVLVFDPTHQANPQTRVVRTAWYSQAAPYTIRGLLEMALEQHKNAVQRMTSETKMFGSGDQSNPDHDDPVGGD